MQLDNGKLRFELLSDCPCPHAHFRVISLVPVEFGMQQEMPLRKWVMGKPVGSVFITAVR